MVDRFFTQEEFDKESKLCYTYNEYAKLESRIAELEQRNRALVKALEYYADPDTYFAIGFIPDPPCGDFTNDFETVFDEYGLDSFKPGKKARQALKENGGGWYG